MNENTLALLTDEEREEYKGMVYDPYTNSPRHEEWDIEELLKAQARKQRAACEVDKERFINRHAISTEAVKELVDAAVTVERDSWAAFIKEHIVKDEDEFDIDAAEAIYFGIFLIPYDALEARSEVKHD